MNIQEEKKEQPANQIQNTEKDYKPQNKSEQTLDFKPSSSFASNNTDDR